VGRRAPCRLSAGARGGLGPAPVFFFLAGRAGRSARLGRVNGTGKGARATACQAEPEPRRADIALPRTARPMAEPRHSNQAPLRRQGLRLREGGPADAIIRSTTIIRRRVFVSRTASQLNNHLEFFLARKENIYRELFSDEELGCMRTIPHH